MNNYQLNKIINIALIVSIVLLFTSIVYFILMSARNSPSSEYTKKAAINYVQGDTAIRESVYSYYNGNDFVQLSVSTGQTETITDYSLLTDIESIYWLQNGAVFNFATEPVLMELSNMINNKIDELNEKNEGLNLASPENLYWYINFDSGELSYLTYNDNPFGIVSDANGDYVYFTDTLTNPNFTYFGSVSSSGDVIYGIYGSSITTPARIIGQDGDLLYIIRSDTSNQQISLNTYNTSTYKLEEIIDDIYSDSLNHTVYEEVLLLNNSIYINTVDEVSRDKALTKTPLSTKQRVSVFTGPESTFIQYDGAGAFTVTDNGSSSVKAFTIDTEGKNKSENIVVGKDTSSPMVITRNDQSIVISRPYIYLHNDVKNDTKIDEKGLEKGYDSEFSSLERQIYSTTNDVNSYVLYVMSGSIRDEYAKLTDHIDDLDVDRSTITIVLQPSREAAHDL